MRRQVDGFTDGLGLGVDEGIKNAVAALLCHGLLTSQSCEGHPHQTHGLPYPWIAVEAPLPQGWTGTEEQKKEWETANLPLQENLRRLLDAYHQHRRPPSDAALTLEPLRYGAVSLQSAGAGEAMKSLSPDQQEATHRLYMEEMDAFTEYLRQRYLQEGSALAVLRSQPTGAGCRLYDALQTFAGRLRRLF